MKNFQMFAAGTLAALSLLGVGCMDTTHDDVTAARREVNQQEQRLQELKRENEKMIDEERHEAERAHTTAKPVIGEEDHARIRQAERDVAEAKREALEREAAQGEKVSKARAELDQTEEKLARQVDRDKFVADARLNIDAANRAVEKLQAERDAADEEGKTAIDDRIKEIKHRRDMLEAKIDEVESADVLKWQDHQGAVEKSIDNLNSFVREEG